MTAFWLSAVALTVVALALLLRPLLWRKTGAQVSRATANISVHRDGLRELDADLAAGKITRADYERARLELEARLLDDVRRPDEAGAPAPGRRLALALGVALPVLAAVLYFLTGNPEAMRREAEHAQSAAQLDAMVERLAAKLRANPDDADGWKLLARSYSALGRYEDAAQAYAKAAARAPRDAQLLADFADALAMARGRRLAGEPEKLVLHALAIDPNNLKALALAGTAAFDRQDYRGAVTYWQRMLPLVEQDSEDARAIRSSIEEARSLIAPGAPPAAAATALKGVVRLAPSLKGEASLEDTVFIFARAAQGPPIPLAVKRAKVRELPLAFELDDSMAMAPGMQLSSFPRVVVGARISKSGSANPQPGDLQGLTAAVANDATGVNVVIDTRVR
jgi:cytochrome c-type biogenesis protein CcmH